MKCDTCKNNWTNREKIGLEELITATENCRACQRNGFKLFESTLQMEFPEMPKKED